MILLLVSSHFFASDFIWQKEMQRALARHAAGEAALVPIIVKPVDLDDAPFNEIQALPTDRKPVTSWSNRDEAWVDVVKGIRRAIERVARPAAPAAPAASAPASAPAPAPPTALQPVDRSGDAVVDASRAFGHALAGFSQAMRDAYSARSLASPAPDQLQAVGETLADVRDPKRILWVDDHPENNRAEIAALRRMQFEVQARVSTEEGLAALTREAEPYDLVISDWSRRTVRNLFQAEGLHLLREMRARGIATPVAFYHGPLEPDALEERRRRVREAGGQLATYRPDELFDFFARTFASGGA